MCCTIADEGEKSEDEDNDDEDSTSDAVTDSCEYELIGVTVHTGTADGGHYYSFIKDQVNRTDLAQDHWYLFI